MNPSPGRCRAHIKHVSTAPSGALFIEGLKLRPSGELVLQALAELDGEPHPFHIEGKTASELAAHTGLSPHVVRARLTDLRRLGLIASGSLRPYDDRHVHALTSEGVRRHRQAQR